MSVTPIGIAGVDDRGRAVELMKWSGDLARVASTDPRLDRMIVRAQTVLMASRGGRMNRWIGVAVGVGFLAASAFTRRFIPGVPPWIILLPPILLLGLGTRRLMLRSWRRCAPDLVRIAVEDGVCAACGYNLYALASEPDGCIVCPECGAAWRADRIRRAEPTPADTGPPAGRMVRRTGAMVLRGFSRTMSVDDGGCPVLLVSPRLATEVRRAGTAEHLQRLLQARRRLAGGFGRWFRWGVAGILLVLFAFPPVFILFVLPPIGPATGAVVPMSLFALLLPVGVLLGNFGYGGARRIRRILLDESVCPACGAEIARGDTPDEVTTCVDCGAAWKLPTKDPAPHRSSNKP
jgi:predicted RNA-binding Zn-ribbon protein involved in translation (DUF1610 family)